ncbi:F21M12.7 gene product [Arabidopsis thaliana]|uniref:Putative pentatricopeptide repeat-containing protein At1g09680 n=1 Tax=Arabidopsis thaliana TaxID=3702 RepID=PPR26_ARATH|nr:Pentatricopeptide repeat (PPR) superfamily protein [Arabidopsis thaliana]O04491.1 RecName: Full=Putative pentatricopeptide repeat-containing protein At1g09680 [Arabidopsis thaliana]AAB60724.1 F21M12.7 gene product [Arabidopsis thaliana]AEE28479.1 Pentatricopeptide repeat (PPR) superfamily protein [Arabidopsis thaliana]|eukprot:NP_172439.1 Pentatricopeptide repeat (PPR) superfamily protein [Arabidopsis thaliana]
MFRIEILRCTLSQSHPQRFSRASFLLSTWYSQESVSAADNDDDPVLVKLSVAIRDSYKDPPLEFSSFTDCPSIRKVLPSLSVHHVVDLINHNPLSLPQRSIFAFFKFISSQPGFRFTVETYFVLARFLAVHEMFTEAQSLIELVVSRKGKNSASSVFISLVEMRVTPMCGFLVDALMITYTDLGFIPDAIQCFRLSRKHRFDVPIRGCGNLLDRMMKLNPTGTIWGFYMEILDAGFPLNVYVFNILMNKFCKEGNISDAQKVFDEITKRSLQPTVVSFNTLINGYCKVGNLDEGFRLKHQMEKSRTRPDVFTYSALINALCKENKMDGAHGLFDEMCKRGLIPNDVIFTTLIHGHSRNGEIDLMKESYQKMLSKGLQPDIVLYNTLVNGFCKNGDLVAARNIVDGMIRRGLRPDKITYTTLIDGFCRGGDVETALEIRKEMDQNGIELDRVGFSALVCGMCKEGRVIDAERALREMLRAGIKPDDVTYTMMMDAFCKKGDAQTGFKLLKEMQSDGHVPSVVTYNVLLNGLCKLGQMKNADMLLDAMLNIGVVPDDITYNTLLEGHHRHANSSKRYIQKPEIGIVADLASYKSIVNELDRASKDHRNR